MNPLKVNLIGLTVGLYLLLPLFFRIGPISVYLLVILAVCMCAALVNRIKVPCYALTNPGWDVRLLLVLIPMLYHREITAIIIYFIAPGLLFLLLMNCVRTRQQVDHLVDVILYCSVVNAAICLIEIASGVNLSYALCTDGSVSYESMYRYGILRVAGAFVNPINNGVFCMMASALVLYRIYSGELSARKHRNFWLIWFANIAIVVLTSSRAALLVTAGVNVLVFWLSGAFRPTAKMLLAIIAVLIVGIFLFVIPNPISDKIIGHKSGRERGISGNGGEAGGAEPPVLGTVPAGRLGGCGSGLPAPDKAAPPEGVCCLLYAAMG